MREAQELMTLALFEYTKAMWPRAFVAMWHVVKKRVLGKDIQDDMLTDEHLFRLHEALLSHKKTLEMRQVAWAAGKVPAEGKP